MGINEIQGKQDKIQVEESYRRTDSVRSRPESGHVDRQQDSLDLSSQTQELLRIRKLVDATPEIRLDRVEELRREIDAGTYHVPSDEIAQAIIDTWI